MPSPFSLLLPVWAGDDADQLARSFASAVTEQVLRPDQVVVVRDGPVGEGLQAVLDALPTASPVPVLVVALPQNVGLARALTAGLAACTHDIVARQDADDVAVPERFAAQIPAVDAGLDLLGSGLSEFVDDEDVLVGRRVPPLTEEAIRAYAPFHSPFNHPTIVFRRRAVQAAGGYQDVGTMEDYWLFVRMLQAGARVGNLAEPLVKYRIGAGAYRRRGGLKLLRTELRLQALMHGAGFTSGSQYLRNVAVRGTYRLLPEAVRRVSYRSLIQRGFRRGRTS
ncbi:glycosyltransferase [uncultured Amnibacterium sp.]|uniref:glycosyltransferase n=1 Tax=uncultured Amnibacterium sp. TaxID=1631851 RepID=UPI0035CA211C